MPPTFAEQVAQGALAIAAATGETVTLYRPDGTSEAIQAIVSRGVLDAEQGLVSESARVSIPVLTVPEIVDGMELEFAPRIGASAKRMRIRRTNEQSAAWHIVQAVA